ncbi:hypothetical protein FDK21_10055 [Cohaesibacter sp. CAU 1516]|uniref:hypothetical protein n=1 Tax=Cohaesibacter sp. CAU 1516 TaxID=2576038 RepID=UPI0010FDCFCE|nr:hypothetical protein [Cohaesibacter sp. CAU 1516]TLP45964.1 hypothetical protein FDK21_10055 [Cohaesibacter sp. CAU 1516]
MSYILYHLELAWAFVRGQDDALYGMDVSRRGLWLSFLAIVIVEPIRLLYAFLFGQMDNFLLFREGGLGLYGLELLLDWGMGPLVFFGFCTIFGFRDRLVPLIVSMNWLGVVVLMIILLPGAFALLSFVPAILALMVLLGIYGFTLWISYRLYRFVLGCPPSMAIGLAVLMLVLALWSIMVFDRLTEALPAA